MLPAPPPVLCPACGEHHYVNPKPCGEAVVVRDGAVLLMRRAHEPEHGLWDVPGGFCESDEHPMHAAERELAEEVGLHGRAYACVGTWMDVYGPPADDGAVIWTAATAYLIALDDPDAEPVSCTEEASAAGWWPLDALPAELAFAAHARPMLTAAVALLDRLEVDRAAGRPPLPLPDRTW